MDFLHQFFFSDRIYFDAFDKLKEAVYVCDTEGNLVYFNKVAEDLDGYLLKDVKGKSTHELYGLDETTSPMLKALYTERPIYNQKFTYYVNDREIVQICNAAPFYYEGELIGAYTIQRDETPMKEIIEKNISLQWEVARHRGKNAGNGESLHHIIGQSEVFLKCKERALQAAAGDSSVMLVGDTGSGKELFARAIHDQSRRAKHPFLALNCAAIPESLIEGILFGTAKGVYTGAVEREGLLSQADGGTIFLDEINSMPLSSQAKLLRVLEDRSVHKLGSAKEKNINVRIISSCNERPRAAVDRGALRADLFYRLSVVHIVIPPLKDRKGDVPLLIAYFLRRYNQRFGKTVSGVSPNVMAFFSSYRWPGNVRQLKNSIESAVNFTEDGEKIEFAALPQYLFETNDTPKFRYKQNRAMEPEDDPGEVAPERPEDRKRILDKIRDQEKQEIIEALQQTKGNLTRAAELLGMSRQSLSYRLKKYGL